MKPKLGQKAMCKKCNRAICYTSPGGVWQGWMHNDVPPFPHEPEPDWPDRVLNDIENILTDNIYGDARYPGDVEGIDDAVKKIVEYIQDNFT